MIDSAASLGELKSVSVCEGGEMNVVGVLAFSISNYFGHQVLELSSFDL
jgi:hypothetical protein